MNARSAALGLVAFALPAVAHAHPCDGTPLGTGAPVRVPLGPADLGVQPEVCGSTMVALEGRAALLVAADDFYGNLLAGAAVRGRLAVGRRSWVSFMLPGVDHRYVANATVDATKTSVSAGALGVHLALPSGERHALVAFTRVLVPTESAFDRTTRSGFDQGISALVRIRRDFDVVFGYAFLALLTSGDGRAHAFFSPSVTADAVYRPTRTFGFAAGASARVVPIDPRPFESFDPHASVRVYPWRGTFATLSGVVPLFGRDRTDVGAALAIGWASDN